MSPRCRITTALLTLLLGTFTAFSIDDGHIESAPAVGEYSALRPARFEISLHRGQLRLDGHTASGNHEHQLLQASQELFSESETHTFFRPLGTVPDQWEDQTLALLNTLATTRSSRAILTNDSLRIRGIGTEDWHEQYRHLQTKLRGTLDFDVDMVIPTADIAVADICARAYTKHEPGPVNFEESGTAFRSSAYRVLDRLISLANACRNASITITGHTDSSGPETWNRHLSLARAQAVADYMVDRGIPGERLEVKGAGSSVPIADNATRYGRGLNRRIDITLRDKRHAEST